MDEDGAGGPSPERRGDCRSRDRGEGGRAACRARSHLRQWTSGQRPAVGGGEQDLPHSTGTSSLHHSSRLGLSSSQRMQTDAVCKWRSPVHQVCAVATTRPSRAEPGEGWRRQCTPSGGECDGPSTHTAVETRTGCRRNVPGEGVPLIPGSTTYLTKTHDAKCQRAHHVHSVSTQSNFLFGAVLVIYTQPAFLIS